MVESFTEGGDLVEMTPHLEMIPHSRTGILIEGTLVSPGSYLIEIDRYDSTLGTWETNAYCVGRTVVRYCNPLWVRPRPDAELSLGTRQLLRELVENKLILAKDSQHWKFIPSSQWLHDPRMDWELLHPEDVEDLFKYGLIEPYDGGGMYPLTNAGRALYETLQ